MIDNEIIKALKCCQGNADCANCPYYENNHHQCGDNFNKDALDLINRKQAEIERLTAHLEELKFLESRVNSIKNTPKDTFTGILISIAEGVARYEAIKEFAERLIDQKSYPHPNELNTRIVYVSDIQEMVGNTE